MSANNSKSKYSLDSSASPVIKKAAHEDILESSKALIHDDFSPLTGKPHYQFILQKSNVKPVYHLIFPVKLHKDLPSKTVPAVIICGGKTWETTFCIDNNWRRLDVSSWKSFIDDNELKIGDVMFWEVLENNKNKVTFKVQIIRGDFPPELQAKVNGKSAATAIIIS